MWTLGCARFNPAQMVGWVQLEKEEERLLDYQSAQPSRAEPVSTYSNIYFLKEREREREGYVGSSITLTRSDGV